MPSFDIVSEVDQHELGNAVDQANREISNRFDFKGTNTKVELSDNLIGLISESEFQVKQVQEILNSKLVKRGIDIDCLKAGDIEENLSQTKIPITVQEGLDKEIAKKVVKLIKQSKMKLQAAIQGEQVRVTGKKRDELQEAMKLVKEAGLGIPVQFTNFRD